MVLCVPAARAAARVRPVEHANTGQVVAAPTRCEKLTDRLLAKTGYSDALRGATQISRMEFQTGLSEIPNLNDADRSQANAAFARAFNPERLRSSVRTYLISKCDAATYEAVLASLSSPLALRMRRLEDASGTKAGAEALRAYYDQMRQNPPSEERVELMERLEKSRHEMEFLQNLMRELGVYRDAPDKDLVQYTAMWLSPAFQRFTRTLGESFDAAFGTGVREAAQAVRPFLKRPAPKPVR